MNAPVTRRALLGATAAVGVLSLPAVAETGIPAVLAPDAGLLALIARYASLVEARNAHADLHSAAEERFRAAAISPCPSALRPTFQDMGWDFKDTGRERKSDGRIRGFFTPSDVERIRSAGPVTDRTWDEHGQVATSEPSPRGEARRRDILSASDAWEAEKRAVADRVGLTDAEVEDDRLYDAMWEARDAIRATAPITMAGFRAKARWVLTLTDRDQFEGDEDAESLVRDLTGCCGVAS